ncbi:MAG: hypothetical protein ACREQV_05160, partial [Candidatus Binatia bacterium]
GGALSLLLSAIEKRLARVKYWRVLGWLLIVLSLDEAASLHERTGLLFNNLNLTGALQYAWVIPGTALIVVAGLWFLGFFKQLEPRLRNNLMMAGGLYVTGALGVEFLEGAVASGAVFGAIGEEGLAYNTVVVVQELMEMAALVILISVLFQEIKRQGQGRGLTIDIL